MFLAMNSIDGQKSSQSAQFPDNSVMRLRTITSGPTFIIPTNSVTVSSLSRLRHSSEHSTKRTRADSEEEEEEEAQVPMQQQMLLSPKKVRDNNYIAPRQVPNSLISSMGSLVGGSTSMGLQNNNLRVHMRRQLSGSQLDSFLGDHDAMDVERPAESRPRSMSF
jgi:hypothetical protein